MIFIDPTTGYMMNELKHRPSVSHEKPSHRHTVIS